MNNSYVMLSIYSTEMEFISNSSSEKDVCPFVELACLRQVSNGQEHVARCMN